MVDPDFEGGGSQHIAAVAVIGESFLAVGSDSSSGEPLAVAWLSSDGRDWEQHTIGAPAPGSTQTVATGLVVTPEGIAIAIGEEGSRFSSQPMVWRSGEGIDWIRAATSFPLGSRIKDVGWDGSNFIAVGSVGTSEVHIDAAVWLSTDGDEWIPVPPQPVFQGDGPQHMVAIAGSPGGIVVVGDDYSNGIAKAAVWTSPDGVEWSRVDTSDIDRAEDAMMTDVLVTDAFYAIGIDTGGRLAAAAWTSSDGTAWTRDEIEQPTGETRLSSVQSLGDDVVGVGEVFGGDSGIATLWIRDTGTSAWTIAYTSIGSGARTREIPTDIASVTGRGVIAGWVSQPDYSTDVVVWSIDLSS